MTVAIPVIHRFACGWPAHGEQCTVTCAPSCHGARAVYGPAGEAFTFVHEWDAHFAAYAAPDVPYRLAGAECLPLAHPAMVLFVLDVEPAGHADPTAEWFAAESAKISALTAAHPGGYVYTTKHGYRVVYQLAQPFVLEEHGPRTWTSSYRAALAYVAQRFQIEADTKCSDWTRLYRLPFVVRDGEVQQPDTFGDPHALGRWELSVVEAPAPAPLTVAAPGDATASPKLLADVRHRLKLLGPAVQGEGGDAKTFQACALVLRGYALSDAEAVQVLSEWDATNVPPWGAELRTKMDNAANYGSGEPGEERARFEERERYLLGHGVDKMPGVPGDVGPQPSAASKVLAQLFNNQGTSAIAETAPTAEAGTYFAVLQQAALDVDAYLGASQEGRKEEPFFMPAGQLFTCDYPPTPWLIRGLLAEGGIGLIGGEAKYAKTWIGSDFAAAVATGLDALGTYPTKAGNVAYFYTEDLKKSIRNKLRAFAASRGIAPAALTQRLHVQPRGRAIDVTNAADCARVVASCRMIPGGVALLVLDPLRNIHSGKENDADAMAEVFRRLRMFSELLSTPGSVCTVLLVHHAGKSNEVQKGRRGGQRLRGSSAIHGFLDAGLYLDDLKQPNPQTFTMSVESEVKGARSAGNFELTLELEDDAQGESVRATWSVGAKGETTASDDQVDTWEALALEMVDAMMVAEAKGAPLRTTKQIKECVKGSSDSKQIALKVARDRGWMRQDRTTQTYALAESGRLVARERAGAPRPQPVDQPTGAHPASGFIKPLE